VSNKVFRPTAAITLDLRKDLWVPTQICSTPSHFKLCLQSSVGGNTTNLDLPLDYRPMRRMSENDGGLVQLDFGARVGLSPILAKRLGKKDCGGEPSQRSKVRQGISILMRRCYLKRGVGRALQRGLWKLAQSMCCYCRSAWGPDSDRDYRLFPSSETMLSCCRWVHVK
jgi:hypothetical protein